MAKRRRVKPAADRPPTGNDAVPVSRREAAAVGAVLLLCVAFLCLTHIRDADTWWHLKTGELIWRSGIPRTDPFSYIIGGRPWLAFEWLSQVIFYPLFRFGGAAALTGFKTLVLGAAFLLLWLVHRERPVLSAAVIFVAALACRNSFVERPWIFDFLFVAALTAAFWRISFREPPRHLRWSLPLATALWANLHGGAAVLAPVLIAAAAGAEWLRERRVPLVFWGQTAALSTAALAVNPHGIAIIAHLWKTVDFPAKELITEWHAPTWELRGLYGAFLVAAAASWLPMARRRPFAAAWLLVLGASSLLIRRNIPLFLIAAVPAIVDAAGAFAGRRLAGRTAAAAVCLLMPAALWAHTRYANVLHFRHLGIGAEPEFVKALAFLDEVGIEGRMFNEYESGGPIIWNAGPRRKVFVDGRSLEYGSAHVRAAMNWFRPEVWAQLDAKYEFDYALVRRHTRGWYTPQALDRDPSWRLVYWDDESLVYLKVKRAYAALLREHGYLLLRPGMGSHQYLEPLLREPATAAALLAELKRALARTPDCVNALLMTAYVQARRGDLTAAEAAAQRAVAAAPERAQPRLTFAWVLAAAGSLDRARAAYLSALDCVELWERATIGADVLNNLGRVEERRGDERQAIRYYRRALRWNSKQGDARHSLRRLSS
ncbi:MAG: tetratricopeptide repeat protein [Elusimicrobiota bacterium]